MTKNPLVNLLQSVTDIIRGFMDQDHEVNERAVSISNVFQSVQDHLNKSEGNTGEIYGGNGYVLDVYLDDAGTFAIITKNDGKLYKVLVTVGADSAIALSAEQEVVMDFAPITGRQVSVARQADGKIRWFALPACTAVLNRSGEIDSRALFDSFVDHVDRTGVYPELDFFHMGESIVLGRADWVARDGFAYCASGLFYDTPIARAAAKSLEEKKDYWGLSIAYLPTGEPENIRSSEGIEIPVFNVGINRFISLLPESTAASILTSISTTKRGNNMNEKVLAALKVLTGNDESLLNTFVEKLNSINRDATGMISRDALPAAQTPVVTPPAAAAPLIEREVTDEDIDRIIASDKFLARVEEIFGMLSENRAAAPEKKTEPTPPVAPAAESTSREQVILDAISELRDSVGALSVSREADVREVLNDLPSKIARAQVVRPRATRMPESVGNNRNNVSLADIAAKTLASMEPQSA